MRQRVSNYLDYIPRHSDNCILVDADKECLEIRQYHVGIYDRIAQYCFHTPAYSDVELDETGSFVWKQIDGQKSIYEIGLQVQLNFGKHAEPIFERMIKYFRILEENKMILYGKIKQAEEQEHGSVGKHRTKRGISLF